MADIVLIKNVGAYLTPRIGSAFSSATAGGAGNNTAVNGTTIDRFTINVPRSAKLTVFYTTTLGASKTFSLSSLAVQDSADGTTWAAYYSAPAAPGVVATDSGSGSTLTGQVSLDVDLNMAREYVRAVYTPVLNATSADTATTVATFVFGGEPSNPAVV